MVVAAGNDPPLRNLVGRDLLEQDFTVWYVLVRHQLVWYLRSGPSWGLPAAML